MSFVHNYLGSSYDVIITNAWDKSNKEVHSRVVDGLLGDCPAPIDTWRTEDGDLRTGLQC